MGRLGTARTSAIALISCLLSSCATAPPPPRRPRVVPVVATTPWPRREVLALARRAYECGAREGQFARPMLTVIDYSLPASERRLWVIDMERDQVLHHELVAHGEGSGDRMAVAFSNAVGSHQSSLGLFRTENTYSGDFGYSLRLSGLEPAINDKAWDRAIVVHGSAEVGADAIARYGTIGRSWGCPMLSRDVAPEIIDAIAGGSAIFAYYPDDEWLRQSHYLHCGEFADAGSAD